MIPAVPARYSNRSFIVSRKVLNNERQKCDDIESNKVEADEREWSEVLFVANINKVR